jgi:hypothetical protein
MSTLIYAVGFLPGGRQVYASRSDNAVCVYDIADGGTARVFAGNQAPIGWAAVSPNGSWLATGARDNSVRVFEFSSGRMVFDLRAHELWVWSVEFTPDSRQIYSASRDGTVAVWSVSDGALLLRKRLHDDEINGLALSADGALVATASDDQTVRLWDADLSPVATLAGHEAVVTRVRFGHHWLASCDVAGVVQVWQVPSGRLMRCFRDHGKEAHARPELWGLATATGQHVASAGQDGIVSVRHVASGDQVARFYLYKNLLSVAVDDATGRILAGAGDGSVRLLEAGGTWRILVKGEPQPAIIAGCGPLVAEGLAEGTNDSSQWPPRESAGGLPPAGAPAAEELDYWIAVGEMAVSEWGWALSAGNLKWLSALLQRARQEAHSPDQSRVGWWSEELERTVREVTAGVWDLVAASAAHRWRAGAAAGSEELGRLLGEIRGKFDSQSDLRNVRTARIPRLVSEIMPAAVERRTAGVPGAMVDKVHFTVASPSKVNPGSSFLIDVWAHLEGHRREVVERVLQACSPEEIHIRSKGPVELARRTVLTVRLQVESLEIDSPEDTILWDGEIGNATFPVRVPVDVAEGSKAGLAAIYAGPLVIAKVHFAIRVRQAGEAVRGVVSREERFRKAFASYAEEDRNEVLGRIQGILKAAPLLEVFLDVAVLRSGQLWEEELTRAIESSDVFYLFWSRYAAASEWVEREWRCALERRGLGFIDPVPLASPKEVPPPPELASKHFNDWVLAYMRANPVEGGPERSVQDPAGLRRPEV